MLVGGSSVASGTTTAGAVSVWVFSEGSPEALVGPAGATGFCMVGATEAFQVEAACARDSFSFSHKRAARWEGTSAEALARVELLIYEFVGFTLLSGGGAGALGGRSADAAAEKTVPPRACLAIGAGGWSTL